MSPPGINHDVFSPGDRATARRRLGLGEQPIVLFVGRIQPLKGVDVTLAAFRRILDRLPDARLLVVGGPSGPHGPAELGRIQRLIADKGLDERVSLLPPVPHADLVDFYRAADVLHVPSRSESFGLVAAEAQACGLPVVASRVGGLSHAVEDGVSGILVDGWEPADHAAALLGLLTDGERAAEYGRGALEWSERFSWDATANRFLELYSGAVARASAR
jgi:D-inositol-3-phosphate glycosyltransferase